MEETHPIVEGYHNNQEPPMIVQPSKMQELTQSSTRSYQIPDYSVPPPNTHTYKSPPDDSLLPVCIIKWQWQQHPTSKGIQTIVCWKQ